MPDSVPSVAFQVNPDGTVRFPIVDQPNVWTNTQEFTQTVTFDSGVILKVAPTFQTAVTFTHGVTFQGVTTEFDSPVLIKFGSAKFDVELTIEDASGLTMAQFFKGGAEAGGWGNGQAPGTFVLPGGDIINVRNVQGGIYVPGTPELLNLDLGAGNSSPGQRGNIGINYDVGCGFVVHDGNTNRVFTINETSNNTNGDGLIQSYLPHTFHGSGVFANGTRSGETYPRVQIADDGSIAWGTGATPLQASTLLHPNGITGMKFDGGLIVGGNLDINNAWFALGDTPVIGYFNMNVNGVSRRIPTV